MIDIVKCYTDVATFHKAFNAPAPKERVFLPEDRKMLRYKLMKEEFQELIQELPGGEVESAAEVNYPNFVKEVIDCLVVNVGTLVEMGVEPSHKYAVVFASYFSGTRTFLPGIKPDTLDNISKIAELLDRYKVTLVDWFSSDYQKGLDMITSKTTLHSNFSAMGFTGLLYDLHVIMDMSPLKPDVWQLAWDEVFRSNMSKLGPDGKPIFREDGKILKGPNYSPANLSFVTDYFDGTL